MLTITEMVSTAPASQRIEHAPNDTRHELISLQYARNDRPGLINHCAQKREAINARALSNALDSASPAAASLAGVKVRIEQPVCPRASSFAEA
jgi:hypothetical protein